MFNFSFFSKKSEAPITIFPKTFPEIHNRIVWFKTIVPSSTPSAVLVSLGAEKPKYDNYHFRVNAERLAEKQGIFWITTPKNTLAVSYPVAGFVVGKSCHDFFPMDRIMPDDSFFTYQMLSARLQATYYNEGGVRYLAGVCLYNRSRESFSVTSKAFCHAMAIRVQYPLPEKGQSDSPASEIPTVVPVEVVAKEVEKKKEEVNPSATVTLEPVNVETEKKPACTVTQNQLTVEKEDGPADTQASETPIVDPPATVTMKPVNVEIEEKLAYNVTPTEEIVVEMNPKGEGIVDAGKGFPVTTATLIPASIEEKIVRRKRCGACQNDEYMVQLHLGKEGVQYGHDESLACAEYIADSYLCVNDKIVIPKNAVMVGFLMDGFVFTDDPISEGCSKEKPTKHFITRRKISENCHVKYWNKDGMEYLSQIYYCLQPSDCSMITVEADKAAVAAVIRESVLVETQDRWESWIFRMYGSYGRHCKTAGRQVSVYYEDGKEPVHQSYNYRTREWKYEECEECREEAKTYKYVEEKDDSPASETPTVALDEVMVKEIEKKKEDVKSLPTVTMKPVNVETEEKPASTVTQNSATVAFTMEPLEIAEKGFLVTNAPLIPPKILKKIVRTETCGALFNDREHHVQLHLGEEGVQDAHDESIALVQHVYYAHLWLSDIVIVPKNTVMVGFLMESFFFPPVPSCSEEDFLTRRKISENCYAEYWNENGMEYLKQIYYCLQSSDCSVITTKADKAAVTAVMRESTEYLTQDRWESLMFRMYRSYGRHCKTAGRQVSVYYEDGKEPVHQSYNYRTLEWKYEECEECREEAKTYKYVEKKDDSSASKTFAVALAEAVKEIEKMKEDSTVTTANQLAVETKDDPADTQAPTVAPDEVRVEEVEKKEEEINLLPTVSLTPVNVETEKKPAATVTQNQLAVGTEDGPVDVPATVTPTEDPMDQLKVETDEQLVSSEPVVTSIQGKIDKVIVEEGKEESSEPVLLKMDLKIEDAALGTETPDTVTDNLDQLHENQNKEDIPATVTQIEGKLEDFEVDEMSSEDDFELVDPADI